MPHTIVDTRGLLCPEPLLKTKIALATIAPGDILEIISTDPSSELDMRVFIRQSGHLMLNSWQEGNEYYFLLKKV
ncbi:MAG: response regulator SirA [Francisellaceae bacterium]|nr:response regulator SirA [Francisellaceae bacterium]